MVGQKEGGGGWRAGFEEFLHVQQCVCGMCGCV